MDLRDFYAVVYISVALFYTSARNAQEFRRLHILSSTHLVFSGSGLPQGYEVKSHYGIDLHFPDIGDIDPLFCVPFGHLSIFGVVSIQRLYLFLKLDIFPCFWVTVVSCVLET